MDDSTALRISIGKCCTACGVWKLLGDFYSESRVKSGRRSRCIACALAQAIKYKKARRGVVLPPTECRRRAVEPDGYIRVKVAGKWLREHRWVMECALGRPLLTGVENVHHRNGVRSDNRRENLELWYVSHPTGQRGIDLKCLHCDNPYHAP